MTIDNEPEVKEVDRVEITPAGEGEENVDDDTEDTAPESSQEETEGDEDETGEPDESAKPDQLVTTNPKPEPAAKAEGEEGNDDLAVVEGETPRERALRIELTNTRAKLRKERTDDLLGGQPRQTPHARELTAEEKVVVGKYKPEEISALKEVLPVLAKEMGFVLKDELQGNTYAEKSQEVLDGFLDKHPEYKSENDKDGTLWESFKSEFQLYNKPANPKDFTKIFERVHRQVFGIEPAKGKLPAVNAQREKTKVASHTGASSAATTKAKTATAASEGYRTDMLKGFTDEEKAELFADE